MIRYNNIIRTFQSKYDMFLIENVSEEVFCFSEERFYKFEAGVL